MNELQSAILHLMMGQPGGTAKLSVLVSQLWKVGSKQRILNELDTLMSKDKILCIKRGEYVVVDFGVMESLATSPSCHSRLSSWTNQEYSQPSSKIRIRGKHSLQAHVDNFKENHKVHFSMASYEHYLMKKEEHKLQ